LCTIYCAILSRLHTSALITDHSEACSIRDLSPKGVGNAFASHADIDETLI